MQKARARPDADTMTRPAKQVLIIDDHQLICHGLRELVGMESGLEVCGIAHDAGRAVELVREKSPDGAIVDISLKEGSGLELIKNIKAMSPHVNMLVSSMHDERIYAERALRAGAMGYIGKDASTDELLGALRQVLEGRIYLSPAMSDRMMRRAVGQDAGADASPIELLSDRELEVLEMIGRGHSTREVADQLHLSVKTIDTYRENLKTKLNVESANELVHYAVAWVLRNE